VVKPNDGQVDTGSLFLFVGMDFATISCNEGVDIKLAFASLIIHVAYFPEDSSLAPSSVVDATNRPHAT
jgi:hypothetical protein